VVGLEFINQLKVIITANTSTSYIECNTLTIFELCEFCEILLEYLQEINKQGEVQNG